MLLSPNLSLDYIDVNAAQREVVHNSAIRSLDALVQLAVLDRDLATPPGSPSDGQRWIVAASPTGAWAGHAKHVAAWQDGAWHFYVPQVGWFAYVIDEGWLAAWNGSAWVDAMAMLTTLQNMVLLGVGTSADATNPFSAKLNNTLWTAKTVAEGGDGNLRYKLSKESASKTLSLLMQTNLSGRTEIGLACDDDFHFKVSSDGSTRIDAVKIARTSGAVAVTAADALALAVGPNGATNPTLQADGSTASAATGLKVKSAAAAAGLALSVISSGTNENLTIDAKGSGTITLGGTSTGKIALGRNLALAASGYANFGATEGSSGYGVRDNAGAVEFKDSGGAWRPLTKPCFSANKNGTNQTYSSATLSKITFTNEAFDVGGYYDAANSKWTPPAGKVLLQLYMESTSTGDGQFFFAIIYKNGAQFAQTGLVPGATTLCTGFAFCIDDANGTDYYEAYAFDSTAGTRTIDGTNIYTRFMGAML